MEGNPLLTYSIALQRLYGEIGSRKFDLMAVSGGGRGRTKGTADYSAASWDTDRKARGAVRGGPIPPGFYIVSPPARHPRLGRSAYLVQTVAALLQADPSSSVGFKVTNRSGFFIHGRGRHGSDGCIVPMEQFDQLLAALETSAPLGLRVVDKGRPWLDGVDGVTRA